MLKDGLFADSAKEIKKASFMYWEGHQNRQLYKEMKEQLQPFQAFMF